MCLIIIGSQSWIVETKLPHGFHSFYVKPVDLFNIMRKMAERASLEVSFETLFGYNGYYVETCKAYGKLSDCLQEP